jgi:hypothetical protein
MELFGQSAQFLIGFESNDLAAVGRKPRRPEPVPAANVEDAVGPSNVKHPEQMLVLTRSIQAKDAARGAAEARETTGFAMSGHTAERTPNAI